MNTYYINLESETARRISVEESFRQYNDRKSLLTRVEAVDAGEIASRATPPPPAESATPKRRAF
jgi:hypothetical protein